VRPPAPERLAVAAPADAARARRAARALAGRLGFGTAAAEEVALAVSELATNLVRYARGGEIVLAAVGATAPAGAAGGGVAGVHVESIDRGPGIANLAQAMEDGYSTGGGLGGGLPAVRRLMDEFVITSDPAGTRVVARKWLPETCRH
jgi:serine/threonine-protein kinase RsbT